MILRWSSDFRRSVSGLGIKSEVDVVENWVGVGDLVNGWDLEGFLLDIDDGSDAGGDNWHFLLNEELLNFPDGELSDLLEGLRDEDLGGVVLPELNNVWLIDGDLEWDLLPLGLFELALDVVWLLFVLSDGDLAGDDVWNLLDDGVVNSLGGLVWDNDVLLNWHLVEDGVWHLLGGDIGDVEADFVWDLSGGGVWDDDFLLVRDLSLDGVWNLSLDFSWLEGLNFVLFSDVLGVCNLVWDLLDGHNWDLLGDLVFLSLVLSHSVDVSVIR